MLRHADGSTGWHSYEKLNTYALKPIVLVEIKTLYLPQATTFLLHVHQTQVSQLEHAGNFRSYLSHSIIANNREICPQVQSSYLASYKLPTNSDIGSIIT